MTKFDATTAELFLRLGATPQRRRAAADRVFRKLRRGDAEYVEEALVRAPRRLSLPEIETEPFMAAAPHGADKGRSGEN